MTVEIALADSGDFTQSGVRFTLLPPIVLTSGVPEWGPVQGGFSFTAHGTGLAEAAAHLAAGEALRVWCRFSRVEIEGGLEAEAEP